LRIGISGAQSVGKTTLLSALRSEKCFKDFDICNEVTRTVKSYGLPINEDGNDVTQKLIMQEHIVNVFMHDKFLTDRTALDGLVYSQYLFEENKITQKCLYSVYDIFKKVQPFYNYQFYIKPEFDIVDDKVRSVDVKFRDRILEIFNQIIDDENIKVYNITGSVVERVVQVKQILGK